MKATLSFQLPDEEQEFRDATNGLKYYCALVRVSEVLRAKAKYSETQETTWEEVKGTFWEIMSNEGVEL